MIFLLTVIGRRCRSGIIIKKKPEIVREHLRSVPISQICISVITQAELLFGLAKKIGASALETSVHKFLQHVDILPWDEDAARQYANIRARLEHAVKPLGSLDLLIAAHALANNAVLVTNDRAFKNIKHMVIADWTK
jgi:tRNA(fMet)-specific endonuclease VapC